MTPTHRLLPALALAAGIAAVLAGCSSKESPPPAPAAAPATTTDGEATSAPREPSVSLPPAESKTTAEQAQTLLQFIEDRPECQSFRAQLEQASQTPAGQPVALDMGRLMDEAYQAGCQKSASGS